MGTYSDFEFNRIHAADNERDDIRRANRLRAQALSSASSAEPIRLETAGREPAGGGEEDRGHLSAGAYDDESAARLLRSIQDPALKLAASHELAVSRLLANGRKPKWKKTCAKCRTVHDRASWDSLPYVGFQPDPDGEQIGLELRNCGCGTTLACVVLRNGELLS